MIFKGLDFESKIINSLSKASFTSFLIHSYFLDYIKIYEFVNGNTIALMFHIVISSILIYLFSYILYKLYEVVILPFVKKVGKSEILQKQIGSL